MKVGELKEGNMTGLIEKFLGERTAPSRWETPKHFFPFPDISYSGSELSRGPLTTGAKFWDIYGDEGSWSVVTASFKINNAPEICGVEVA